MTASERTSLRRLQDRWLRLNAVKADIKARGWEAEIGLPGSPTYGDLNVMLFPQWSEYFRQSLERAATP